jgi:hypothetical protein
MDLKKKSNITFNLEGGDIKDLKVPVVGQYEIQLPPYFATKTKKGWKLLNPLTTIRNLAVRNGKLAVGLNRDPGSFEPQVGEEEGVDMPSVEDFSAADQKKLIQWDKNKNHEGVYPTTDTPVKARGRPAFLPKNALKQGFKYKPGTNSFGDNKKQPKAVKPIKPPKPPKPPKEPKEPKKRGRPKQVTNIIFDNADIQPAPRGRPEKAQKEMELVEGQDGEFVYDEDDPSKLIRNPYFPIEERKYKGKERPPEGEFVRPAYLERRLREQEQEAAKQGRMVVYEDPNIPKKKRNRRAPEGKGLFDKIKDLVVNPVAQALDIGKKVLTGINKDYPSSAKKIIEKYGDKKVVGVSLHRKVLPKIYTDILSVWTKGETAKRLAEEPKDKLFHISMWVSLEGGTTILCEKNLAISFTLSPKKSKQEEVQAAKTPTDTTFKELLDKGQAEMGDRYFPYSAKDNNCGNWIEGVLKGNKINDGATKAFIGQDTKKILSGYPQLRKVLNTLTDIGRRANVVMEGGVLGDQDDAHNRKLTPEELEEFNNQALLEATPLEEEHYQSLNDTTETDIQYHPNRDTLSNSGLRTFELNSDDDFGYQLKHALEHNIDLYDEDEYAEIVYRILGVESEDKEEDIDMEDKLNYLLDLTHEQRLEFLDILEEALKASLNKKYEGKLLPKRGGGLKKIKSHSNSIMPSHTFSDSKIKLHPAIISPMPLYSHHPNAMNNIYYSSHQMAMAIPSAGSGLLTITHGGGICMGRPRVQPVNQGEEKEQDEEQAEQQVDNQRAVSRNRRRAAARAAREAQSAANARAANAATAAAEQEAKEIIASGVESEGNGLGKKKRFVKGSQEAKDFMASIRRKKGSGLCGGAIPAPHSRGYVTDPSLFK